MLESASASRTCVPRYGHLYDRLCDLIWGRQLAVAEHPLTRLAPRPLGAGGPPALGERSRLALSGSLEFCELLAQPFVGRRQLGVLPLQLGNLPLLTYSNSMKSGSSGYWDEYRRALCYPNRSRAVPRLPAGNGARRTHNRPRQLTSRPALHRLRPPILERPHVR